MANPEHVALLKQGVAEWNAWRTEHPEVKPDLMKADFMWANLSKAHLVGANLGEADLLGAYLVEADFMWADLRGANLLKATLTRANLSRANLSGANLSGADLLLANLSAADLRGADLRGARLGWANFLIDLYTGGANLTWANLSGANLSGADLGGASLIETDLTHADLTGCYVYGTSAWNVNLAGAVQKNLVITKEDEPEIQVDDLELAQFVYLLLNNAKLRHVIDTITSKVVLILGRFTEERKAVLDGIREALRKHDYVPVLFDFDKPESKDTHETVTTLARMARFIIADITDPKSIPQELVSIVEQLPSLAVQPILLKGGEPWGMYDHIRRYPWVLPLELYDSQDELLDSLEQKVILPAEAKVEELRAKATRL